MRKLVQFLFFSITIMVYSCADKVEPEVETIYLDYGTRVEMRTQALSKLHDHYISSDKSKKFYEVIARDKDKFILNYCPSDELLSFCNDQGSGWSVQYKDVNLHRLKMLADFNINLDTLRSFIYKDTLITRTEEWIPIKTNGEPTI